MDPNPGDRADRRRRPSRLAHRRQADASELVRDLLELTGSKLEPEYQPQAMSFVTQRIGSIDKAERLLGFRAHTPLADGLQRVVAWRRDSLWS